MTSQQFNGLTCTLSTNHQPPREYFGGTNCLVVPALLNAYFGECIHRRVAAGALDARSGWRAHYF